MLIPVKVHRFERLFLCPDLAKRPSSPTVLTCSGRMLWEDAMLAKRLAAATAAYVAVHVKGRADAELQKDAVMLGRRAENNGIRFQFFPECVARVPVSLWGSGG